MQRGQVQDPGYTQIRNLGSRVGGEEDVDGREEKLAVEVAQAVFTTEQNLKQVLNSA